MPDHVHLLLSSPPKISVASFMGYLKGKSAWMMFDKHANLKYKFGNRHFWAEGYYVTTVGLNEATIAKYIRDQEKKDMVTDKLISHEYEDPLQGWQVVRTPLKVVSNRDKSSLALVEHKSQRRETLAGNRGL